VVAPTPPRGVQLGDPVLFDGTTFLRPDVFSQANARVNEQLVEAAVNGLNPGASDRVLELFSGSGNFTLPLAKLAGEVLAVEGNRASLELLARALKTAALSNVKVHSGPAEAMVDALASSGSRFDLVLLDPPRAGAAELMDALARLGPRRIAYVSCEPATLARDLKALLALGYRLEAATVFDQFPQTYHLEALVVLARHDAPRHAPPPSPPSPQAWGES
jgi:23S rRNA (uracil1939-C5)-methyltransferase